MVTKNILNNSKLIKIKEDPNKVFAGWRTVASFEYWYFDQKVAEVSFSSTKCDVEVYDVYAPWAHIENNKRQFFAKLHIIDDQLHGVNIIEFDNLQSLFMEYEVNTNIKADKTLTSILSAQQFAKTFNDNTKQIIASMSRTTFPVWNIK